VAVAEVLVWRVGRVEEHGTVEPLVIIVQLGALLTAGTYGHVRLMRIPWILLSHHCPQKPFE
jgi:hypothetical protein